VRIRSVRVRAKFLKLLRVRAGLNFTGAGRVRTQNFNPRRTPENIGFEVQSNGQFPF